MKCLDGSNDVKVYNLTASKTLPEWLSSKKKKRKTKAKNNQDIIQDFEMPDLSSCLQLSPDGEYMVVCGTYPPVLKCWDLNELSIKFERGMDAEVLRFQILSDDYSKMVFLQEGRYLELHGQGGRVERLRVPRFGRDLAFHYPSADMYIAASGDEIYRLNLYQGRFLNSVDAGTNGVNRLSFSKEHGLLMCGTDDGHLQCYDPRTRGRVATLDCGKHMLEHTTSFDAELKSRHDLRVTALEWGDTFLLGVGNHTGQILMYDTRINTPYLVRDHHYRSPIKDLHFHSSGNVFSMAPEVVKIWDKNTGAPFTSMEGDAPFNSMAVVPNTGLSFYAAEDKRMKAFFLPSLGPAPTWCSHLDAMTEELEDTEETAAPAQFDDYTFVTREDLVELGLKDLIGTSLLRAVMHGYYMNTAAYTKAKQIANPVKPETVIKQKLKDTMAEQNTVKLKTKSKTSINQDLLENATPEVAKTLMDDRFSKLFTSKKFSRDPAVERVLDRSSGVSQKRKEAFAKRQAEIDREEEEFEPEKMEESVESDVDSVMDALEADDRDSDPSTDEEREKQMQKLFRPRSKSGRGK